MRTPSSALPFLPHGFVLAALVLIVFFFVAAVLAFFRAAISVICPRPYLYMVWFLVPGAYSFGSTQMFTTADLPVLATISRALLSAGAISAASRTSTPHPPHICGKTEKFMSPSLLPTLPRSGPYLAICP